MINHVISLFYEQAIVQEIQTYSSAIASAVEFSQILEDVASKAKIIQLMDEYTSLSEKAKVCMQDNLQTLFPDIS